MKYCRVICYGLLVALATLLGITSAPAQNGDTSCADASKHLQILEQQKKMWEKKRDDAQKRIEQDTAQGKPIRQEDLTTVSEAKGKIAGLDQSIADAQKQVDASCGKEKESCAKKKMSWCNKENRCVEQSYNTCDHCGCGVPRK